MTTLETNHMARNQPHGPKPHRPQVLALERAHGLADRRAGPRADLHADERAHGYADVRAGADADVHAHAETDGTAVLQADAAADDWPLLGGGLHALADL